MLLRVQEISTLIVCQMSQRGHVFLMIYLYLERTDRSFKKWALKHGLNHGKALSLRVADYPLIRTTEVILRRLIHLMTRILLSMDGVLILD